jgi:hypothetical protein
MPISFGGTRHGEKVKPTKQSTANAAFAVGLLRWEELGALDRHQGALRARAELAWQ